MLFFFFKEKIPPKYIPICSVYICNDRDFNSKFFCLYHLFFFVLKSFFSKNINRVIDSIDSLNL